jgi:hypothetical protein
MQLTSTMRIISLAALLAIMTGVTADELVRTVRASVIVRLFNVCSETTLVPVYGQIEITYVRYFN